MELVLMLLAVPAGLIVVGLTCSFLTKLEDRTVQEKKRTADEINESWLKMAERRGMSYEWLQEARASHEDIKRRAARAKGN